MAVKLPDLGQMIGPLPLGGWVAVVGGGLGLAYVAKRSGGGGDAEEVPEAPPPYPAIPGTAGPRNLPAAPPDTTQAPPPITDNGEWISQAVRQLTTLGYAPYTTQQCLARYLEGVIQGGDCVAIIDKAILLVGPPPTGAPVNQFPTVPSAPPPNNETPGRVVNRTTTVFRAIFNYPDNSKPATPGAFTSSLDELRRAHPRGYDFRVVSTKLGRYQPNSRGVVSATGTEAVITWKEEVTG